MKKPSATLTECDREPIHIPGAIQPFAWLIIVDQRRVIRGISDNLPALLEQPQDALLGQRLDDIQALQSLFPKALTKAGYRVNDLVHNTAVNASVSDLPNRPGWLALELEYTYRDSNSDAETGELQSRAISLFTELLNSQEHHTLYTTLLDYIRELVGYDRCMMYQFDPLWNGCVIAESKDSRLEPFLGLHYPASDIPQQARLLYTKKLIRVIEDVDYSPVSLKVLHSDDATIDMTYLDSRAVSPVHIQYLKNMGVQATMTISILVKGQLWGMIACHHYQGKKYLNYEQRKACATIALLTALMIERLNNDLLLQKKAQLREALPLLDMVRVLQNPNEYKNITQRIMQLTGSHGVALMDGRELRSVGNVLPYDALQDLLSQLDQTKRKVHYITCLRKIMPQFPLPDSIAGVCVILPLTLTESSGSMPTLFLFRQEVNSVVTWAGNPNEKPTGPDGPSPRKSFSQWKQVMKDHCQDWSQSEQAFIEELQILWQEACLIQIKLIRIEELKLIAESSEIGIFTLDINSGNLYWNERMFDIYGVDDGSFGGSYADWQNCLVEQDKQDASLTFERCVHEKRPFQHSFRINHPIKGARVIRAHAHMLINEDGDVSKVIGTNVDLTDELAMNEAMHDQVEMNIAQNRLASLGELAATIGHEINNPLAIIMSSLELQQFALEETPPLLEDAVGGNQRALSASERIGKIVAGLRSLARKSSSKDKLQSCHLPSAVTEITDMMTELFRKENLTIETNLQETSAYAAIDVSSLQQVLMNLINNAKDAMTEAQDRVIEIDDRIDNQYIYLTITDHGVGIPLEKIEKIFSPFFTTKERGKGTGLGLSISRTLLREIDGDLTVESVVGRGTRFTMKIPLSHLVPPKTDESPPAKSLGLKILLVDDEDELRFSLKAQLAILGCTVDDACSAADAGEKLKHNEYDALLIDSHMPRMTGEELLVSLPSIAAKSILMTGDVTKSFKQLVKEGVPISYLLFKPIRSKNLADCLESLFPQKHIDPN